MKVIRTEISYPVGFNIVIKYVLENGEVVDNQGTRYFPVKHARIELTEDEEKQIEDYKLKELLKVKKVH